MKKLLLLIVLIVIGVPVALFVFGGKLLGEGVERGGTYVLGTPTTVDGASLNVLTGSVGLDDLTVKNPEGFQTDHAIRVGSIDVKTDVQSLLSDTIRIDSIEIDSPAVVLEVTTGGTNLGRLMDNLERMKGAPSTTPEDEPGAASKKMHVGRLVITTPEVRVVQSLLAKNEAVLNLPTLTMEEVGNDLTMAELLEKILALIMTGVGQAQIGGDLKAILDGEVVGEAKRKAQEAIGNVQKELDKLGVPKEAQDALKKGVEGLGGILGGKDKDKKD